MRAVGLRKNIERLEVRHADGSWHEVNTPDEIRELLYEVGANTEVDVLALHIRFDDRDGKFKLETIGVERDTVEVGSWDNAILWREHAAARKRWTRRGG